MRITLSHLRPIYMSEQEISCSDIYMQDSLVFSQGSKYLIRAHSGRGKSSLLNFIYGSSNHYCGEISYDDKLKAKGIQSEVISYVFQDLKLFPTLTVWENIKLKNDLTHYKSEAQIEQMIVLLGLSFKRNQLVGELSFGQQQRVAILRALCQPFDFLFLDEPFSHLDHENVKQVVALIEKELASQKAGLLLTSLDPCVSFKYDSILHL